MTRLTKLNVSRIADQLDKAFSMIDVAHVGDIAVSIYICEGTLQWHRHIDLDELFWVHEGVMSLESEWGNMRLGPGELTVVPKGVKHRSRSEERASVLLLRCGFLADRKNGRRRLYPVDENALRRVNLHEAAQALAAPFQYQTVARIEDTALQIGRGQGTWPIQGAIAHDRLLLLLTGGAVVRTFQSLLHMHSGDFTVVPRGATYHLHGAANTVLVQVTREDEE